jgi:hypothetical protein
MVRFLNHPLLSPPYEFSSRHEEAARTIVEQERRMLAEPWADSMAERRDCIPGRHVGLRHLLDGGKDGRLLTASEMGHTSSSSDSSEIQRERHADA